MRILFATRNPGKLQEARWLFQRIGWEVVGLAEMCPDLFVPEDGRTYLENARKKAQAAFARTRMWCLGEDSGLEVDALSGAPGVESRRFAGENATDFERNRRLLEMLIALPDERRTARFRCVVCLIDPEGGEEVFEGVCPGKIAHTIRGISGFGYDPVFIPSGYGFTFAELGVQVKNRVSHRARALEQVIDFLRRRTGSES